MKININVPHGIPCIYEIYNTKTGKRYIGSTNRFRERFLEHRKKLKNKRHHSRYLQCSYEKHGCEAFLMRPLEIVRSYSEILEREQFWMDKIGFTFLYNNAKTAGKPNPTLHPIYSIHAKTGKKTRFRSINVACRELYGSTEYKRSPGLAAKYGRLSKGHFWTYDKNATLESILEYRRRKVESRLNTKEHRVFAFDADNNFVMSFLSASSAARALGVNQSSISQAIHSERFRTVGGFTWSTSMSPKKVVSKKTKKVLQIKDGVVVYEWNSCREAARSIEGATYRGISSAATGYTKTHRGYKWEFAKT